MFFPEKSKRVAISAARQILHLVIQSCNYQK
jgi:hypothetical protein